MSRRRKAAIIAACCIAGLAHAALLASLTISTSDSHESTLVAKASADLNSIAQAARLFRHDHGRWPSSIMELETAMVRPTGGSSGPYLKGPALDPWSQVPYQLRAGCAGALELLSLGADRVPGGQGTASDLMVVVSPRDGSE